MTNNIFVGRTEKRYLVPTAKTNFVTSFLGDYELFCPNGIESTHLLSTYFGRHGSVNKKGLIRVRMYDNYKQQTSELKFKPTDTVFLEIKYKNGEKIDKKRCITTYGEVVEKLCQPNLAINWLIEKVGLDKSQAKSLFEEFDYLGIYPQFAIVTNRTHYHPKDSSKNIRITLDKNINYYAFQYGQPYYGIGMGGELQDKLEIKVGDNDISLLDDLNTTIQIRGGLQFDTLQSKVENLYKETSKLLNWKCPSKLTNNTIESTPMHSLREMEGILINEFNGQEFEIKVQVTPKKPKRLIENIKSQLLNQNIKGFSLIINKTEISSWIYFMDYYGYLNKCVMQVAFAVVRHPDKDKFMVQYKNGFDKLKNEKEFVIARNEFKFRVERKFQESDLDVLKSHFEELTNQPVSYVGTNRRKKYYIFLQNNKSKRYYTLSTDMNNCDGKKMVQMEIEYKGKDPSSTSKDNKNEVLDEISVLTSEIKNIPRYEFLTTELRKFDWIKSLKKIT